MLLGTDLSIFCVPDRHFTAKLYPKPSSFILHFLFLLFFTFFIYCYYVYMYMTLSLDRGETTCVCHGMTVEIRVQVHGITSLHLPLFGSEVTRFTW